MFLTVGSECKWLVFPVLLELCAASSLKVWTFWWRQHFSQSVDSTTDHVHVVQSAKNRINMNIASLWNPKTSKANCEGFDLLDVMVHHWISDSRVQVPILKPQTWRQHISSKNQEKLGDAASHPRGLNSYITLLWKPQNLQRKCYIFAWVRYHTRVTGSAGQILFILTCNIRRSASRSGHHYSWREHTLSCISWRGARTIVGVVLSMFNTHHLLVHLITQTT